MIDHPHTIDDGRQEALKRLRAATEVRASPAAQDGSLSFSNLTLPRLRDSKKATRRRHSGFFGPGPFQLARSELSTEARAHVAWSLINAGRLAIPVCAIVRPFEVTPSSGLG